MDQRLVTRRMMDQHILDNGTLWENDFREVKLRFFSQMTIVTIVIIGAVYNLTVGHENPTLWTALLSSCLGYILPNPSIQRPSSPI